MFVLAIFGALLGVAALTFKMENAERARRVLTDLDSSYSPLSLILGGVAGYGFLIAGVLARIRRPENRTGSLMVLVGVGLFAEDLQLSTNPQIRSVGLLFVHASSALLVHLVLAFPVGRLTSRVERVLTAAAYLGAFGVRPVMVLFIDSTTWQVPKPNLLFIADDPALVRLLDTILKTTGMVVATGTLLVLIRRWLRASPPARHVLAPMFLAALLGGVSTVASVTVPEVSRPLGQVFTWPPRVAACLVPVGFLIGLWRVRAGRTAVTALLTRLRDPMSAVQLRTELAEALGDPSLQVGYWRPDIGSFVDGEGQPLDLPDDGEDRAVTMVEPGGRRIAVLVHDPALQEDRHVLDAVVAAAELALENQRLTAEVRAQLAEVRALAGRLVTAGDAERQRLERDLHDGAQQRLVTAILLLRTALDHLHGTADARSTGLLTQSLENLNGVVGELRDLARGIHPSILTDAGLLVALRSLVDRITEPTIVLSVHSLPRLSPSHEATAYFVATEAVTNALKHARATRIDIEVHYGQGVLRIIVTDDGRGGADIRAGSGLLGLRDRVTALGGTMSLRSGAAEGTSVMVSLPAGAAT